jgi:hypothetical protein
MRYLNGARRAIPRLVRMGWAYWLERVLSTDGWYMPRHVALPGHPDFGREGLVGQLRPDAPVVLSPTGWEWHHHWFDLNRYERGAHEASVCTWSAERHGEPFDSRVRDGKTEYLIPTGHLHPDTGELVVPFRRADGRYKRHRHWEEAKYVYTPGDTAKGLATNPLTLANGYGEGLFVIVLEGTLKMCAVTEAGYPCIDAGSVTLWHRGTPHVELDDEGNLTAADFVHRARHRGGAPMRLPAALEIEAFAERYLEGRPVAVVCDSDWNSNEAVRDQTEMVATILQEYAGEVFACAPPEGPSRGWRHPITNVEQHEKRGVDDWLGEHAREERADAFLEIGHYEDAGGPTLTVEDPRLLVPGKDGRRPPITGRRSAVALVLELARRATPDGVARYELNDLTKALGLARSNVQEAFKRSVDAGLVEPLTRATKYSAGTGVRTEAALVRVTPDAMATRRWRSLRDWLR